MRGTFDAQLNKLNDMLIEMGTMIETAITLAMKALKEQDLDAARQAKDFDELVDRQERDIETLCLRLLLQQQPVASDLRLISAALKMITDMERISDQAADIAEISTVLAGTPFIKELEHIPQMAAAAIKMVTDSIDAFVKRDLELAKAVEAYDDVVDDLFDRVKNDLIELIRENPENGEQAIDLLMITKYLERIGDHATNIGEWVEFAITGHHGASGQAGV